MTIIIFLIDTSASMNQRSNGGTSYLDLAKGAVETFLKFRSRDPSSRGVDRYMLLTFDDPPKNIKAGWKENQATFMQELRNLRAAGLTTCGAALGNALHLLNVNRLQSGIDNFGFGRYPNWLESAMILLVTDGCTLTTAGGVSKELDIPSSSLQGCELYKEPFRWDQRIFALVLRIPGHPLKNAQTAGIIPQDSSSLDSLCEATGGRSYSISNVKMLNQCLESLVQKVQTGVVVVLEKFGQDPTPNGHDENDKLVTENGFIRQANNKTVEIDSPEVSWHRTRKMFYVLRAAGRGCVVSHWPIPESFWPDSNGNVLPPRSSQPVIRFKCDPCEPMVFPDLPFDKYEMEPSPLTQFILERKQPATCWQVFVERSGKYQDLGQAFGYLKASSTLTSVNLFVMPYNYPVLVPLLDELKNGLKNKPTPQWRQKFDKYLRGVPPYYLQPLKKALQKNNFNVMQGEEQNFLSYNVLSYLGKVKHRGREEYERICQNVGQPLAARPPGLKVVPRSRKAAGRNETAVAKTNFADSQLKLAELSDSNGFRIFLTPPPPPPAASTSTAKAASEFQNAFDVQRTKLLHQLAKMRVNFAQHVSNSTIPVLEGGVPGTSLKLQHAEVLHSLPISQMGNYQDYLKMLPPAPKMLENSPVRQHAFGNPFKVDKRMLVDEADIDVSVVGSGNNSTSSSMSSGSVGGGRASKKLDASLKSGNAPKRKAGPLPRDFRYSKKRRRRSSDSSSFVTDDDLSLPNSPAPSDVSSMEANEFNSDTSSLNEDRLQQDSDSDLSNERRSPELMRVFSPPAAAATTNHVAVDDQTPSTSKEGIGTTKREMVENHVDVAFCPTSLPDIKRSLALLIRKPGKDYRELFKAVEDVESPIVRTFLLNFCCAEAARLKRAELCESIRSRLRTKVKTIKPG